MPAKRKAASSTAQGAKRAKGGRAKSPGTGHKMAKTNGSAAAAAAATAPQRKKSHCSSPHF